MGASLLAIAINLAKMSCLTLSHR
ncbi:hypothetical protein EMIT0232MI5_160010 [Pseudomonas sp. IT-232MI5]